MDKGFIDVDDKIDMSLDEIIRHDKRKREFIDHMLKRKNRHRGRQSKKTTRVPRVKRELKNNKLDSLEDVEMLTDESFCESDDSMESIAPLSTWNSHLWSTYGCSFSFPLESDTATTTSSMPSLTPLLCTERNEFSVMSVTIPNSLCGDCGLESCHTDENKIMSSACESILHLSK